jgi:hypothetical protein
MPKVPAARLTAAFLDNCAIHLGHDKRGWFADVGGRRMFCGKTHIEVLKQLMSAVLEENDPTPP